MTRKPSARNSQAPDTEQPAAGQAETTQNAPTAEPLRDENGWELDQWGLPICKPVRITRLAALGMPDPNEDPDAWPEMAPDAGDTPPAPADPGVNDEGGAHSGDAVNTGTTTEQESQHG